MVFFSEHSYTDCIQRRKVNKKQRKHVNKETSTLESVIHITGVILITRQQFLRRPLNTSDFTVTNVLCTSQHFMLQYL